MFQALQKFIFLVLLTLAFAENPVYQNVSVENNKMLKTFPDSMISLEGNVIDLKQLVKRKKVVVITLKATWCKVCQKQLIRVNEQINLFKDCNATFLVLSPGPNKKLREIKQRTEFNFPFIEDKGMLLSKSLGLQISDMEIMPSLIILDKQKGIHWIQLGRGMYQYGDPELMQALNCKDWI